MLRLRFMVLTTNREREIINTPATSEGNIRLVRVSVCPFDCEDWLVSTRLRLPAGNTNVVC
jgi:hypothetical protein